MSEEINNIRHSMAHLLAQAVKQLYPETQLGIGPVIENGFYYDFKKEEPFTPKDLKDIYKRMKELSKKGFPIEKVDLSKAELKNYFEKQPLKKELYDELKEKGESVTFYKQGEFIDLCRGGHVETTKKLKNFRLTKSSGAYWRGDSKNLQLQRIYGVAFESDEELKTHLEMLRTAELRNHRKIGEEMELYALFDLVGKGLPVWLPKGEIIRKEIENYAIEMEKKAGYVRVSTPHLAKEDLFLKSGHLPYYADTMYPSMEMDDGKYYLKAMNCPMHHLIYSRKVRSYRELPLRIAEYGTCYRNELSGALNGLQRVRILRMNDAHIYCTKENMEQEIEGVLLMTKKYFEVFGLKDYSFRLSLWDPSRTKKYIDQPENWEFSEGVLRKVLQKLKLPFKEIPDEAAFYGPKIDIQFKNVFGKEDSLSTIQLDFLAKERFDLHYDDAEGKQNSDVFVIHRAPLSTHERFMAFVIEHFAGKFPVWLNPTQVKIITVTDRSNEFAQEVERKMLEKGIRVEIDLRSESIAKKVRQGIKQKVNYLITIGDKEVEKKNLAIRNRSGDVEHDVSVDAFIKRIVKEIKEKC
jgi:threonyl-tRNA synthetase